LGPAQGNVAAETGRLATDVHQSARSAWSIRWAGTANGL